MKLKFPIGEEVKGACEILGLDPLYVANEGKLFTILPAAQADRVLAAMQAHRSARRPDYRRSHRRTSRLPLDEDPVWWHPRGEHAFRRAAAADLLTSRYSWNGVPLTQQRIEKIL
jgi:hypothetical protein